MAGKRLSYKIVNNYSIKKWRHALSLVCQRVKFTTLHVYTSQYSKILIYVSNAQEELKSQSLAAKNKLLTRWIRMLVSFFSLIYTGCNKGKDGFFYLRSSDLYKQQRHFRVDKWEKMWRQLFYISKYEFLILKIKLQENFDDHYPPPLTVVLSNLHQLITNSQRQLKSV